MPPASLSILHCPFSILPLALPLAILTLSLLASPLRVPAQDAKPPAAAPASASPAGGAWQSIFDAADASVKKSKPK
jgi:hypothetical protein